MKFKPGDKVILIDNYRVAGDLELYGIYTVYGYSEKTLQGKRILHLFEQNIYDYFECRFVPYSKIAKALYE